jgi:hypothetical protein
MSPDTEEMAVIMVLVSLSPKLERDIKTTSSRCDPIEQAASLLEFSLLEIHCTLNLCHLSLDLQVLPSTQELTQ